MYLCNADFIGISGVKSRKVLLKTTKDNGVKRLILILLLISLAVCGVSQTQTGMVKTRGRMVGGKHVPGTLLSGATVQVDGNQTILAKDGNFSFPVSGGWYTLNSVTKQGYKLLDADVCRQHNYSATPLQIVMEMPDQQMQDKLTAERKIRRQLQDQLRDREDEIEAMREQKRLTDEQYRNAMQELYASQESNERLISDMAKRYSELDYDQLDDFQRQVSNCIENGQLARADSLLRSRGDVGKQVEASLKAGAALQQQREQLGKAEAVHAAEIEEMAQRCYSYYEMFAARFQNDSAARYLELRARLDSNNFDWMSEAAYFIEFYLADYNKALSYYQRMLAKSLETYGEGHPYVATAYTGMGRQFMLTGDTKRAFDCFDKALEIRKKCYNNEHPLVASSLNNLGEYYLRVEDCKNALDRYNQAIPIYLKTLGENSSEVASCYNSIGICYMNIDTSFQRSMDNFAKALAIDTALYGINHPDVSMVYMNIANLYANVLEDNKKASEYYVRCLEIEKKLLGEKHPRVARIYNNMASNALLAGEFDNASDYSFKAVDIIKHFFGDDNIELVDPYDYIGYVHIHALEYDQALQYFKKSETIARKAYGEDALQMCDRYSCLAGAYLSKDEFDTALIYYHKALSVKEKHLDKNDTLLADSHLDLGVLYSLLDDYDKALEHYSRALEIYKKNKNKVSPEMIDAIKAEIEDIKQKQSEKKQK